MHEYTSDIHPTKRSITLCTREDWPPHQIGVAKMTISAIFSKIADQSSESTSM
jgi:hypothetical protein